jgi:sterol desaturase/sphingolipid hydroxylase (fatty acid hydroxylase superfamily)
MPFLMVVLCFVTSINPIVVLVGFLLWSPLEYLIHRVVFHNVPFARKSHQEHHAKPSGKTGYSSFHSLAIFLVLTLVLPSSLVVGITAGYFCYICMHHGIHHWRIPVEGWMYPAKMRHLMHHRGLEVNFGVTSTLWDHVFGTFEAFKSKA